MNNKKTMKIELSGESPISPDYFYAELELPASAYEIEDAMQRARILGAHPGNADISVNECKILPELTDVRINVRVSSMFSAAQEALFSGKR